MEHVDNAYAGLHQYFDVLEQTGQYDGEDAKGLLIYSFIVDQVFDGNLQYYLDDAGLAAFNRAISCISRSNCLVGPVDRVRLSEPRGVQSGILRADETTTVRISETDILRRIDEPQMYVNLRDLSNDGTKESVYFDQVTDTSFEENKPEGTNEEYDEIIRQIAALQERLSELAAGGGSGSDITIDEELDINSTNPVTNAAITKGIQDADDIHYYDESDESLVIEGN